MSRLCFSSDGVLFLDGQALPCVITSIRGRDKMVMDGSSTEGSSGKKRVFDGYEDWDLSLELLICEPHERGLSRYDHLAAINSAFKRLEKGMPVIYTLEGVLAQALDIRQVLFVSLDVEDSNETDALAATLSFSEHDPLVSLYQKQSNDSSPRANPADASVTEDELVSSPQEEALLRRMESRHVSD